MITRIGYLIFTAILFWQCSSSSSKAEGSESTSNPIQKRESSASKKLPKSGIPRLDSINEVIAQDASNVNAWVERARFNLMRNQPQKAFLDLLKAQEIDSLAPQVLQVMGEYRMSLNQSREARDAWSKCIQFDAKNISCRLSLGKLFYTVGNYEKGLDLFNEVIKIDAYQQEAFFYKALILRDFYKDSAKAKEFLQKAIELKQDYVEALDVMGVLMTQTNDTLAPYYYQRALEYSPNNADLYYKLGVYYMNSDQLNKAIEAYTQATQINPKHADSFYNLGFMFIQLKDYQTARDYFTKAIKASDQNYKALYGRGYAFEMLGDVINAKKDYRAALQALPMYKPAGEALSRIKRRENQQAE